MRAFLPESLDRVFHEPARLAILSQLVRQPEGIIFRDLRLACGLTDGNLSRHLKMLEEAEAVQLVKSLVDRKPQTRVLVTDSGTEAFAVYLQQLREVVMAAKQRLRRRK